MKHQNSIIRAVQVTEKGDGLGSLNKYFLEVDRSANKFEIKKAVQELFNVTVLDEGQQFATVSGTTATVTIAVSYWDGSTTVTRTLGEQICNVKNVAPGNDVDVQGERKATIVITLEPVGGGARSALALPAGS